MGTKKANVLVRIYRFYADGFRQMTWGRTLWLIIAVKLVVMFVVLRIFFFQPYLKGLSPAEKAEVVGRAID